MKKIFIVLFLFPLFACAQKEITNYPPKSGPIVAFGNSLTYGQGVEAQEAYPALLEKMWDREVINLGISGQTAVQGSARKSDLRFLEPSFVLIEFGANDLFQNVPRAQTKQAFEEMVDYVQNLGAVAVLIDTGGDTRMRPYTRMMKKIAKQKGALFVPGIMDGVITRRNFSVDNLHPNENGYEMIAQKIDKFLRPYIKNIPYSENSEPENSPL